MKHGVLLAVLLLVSARAVAQTAIVPSEEPAPGPASAGLELPFTFDGAAPPELPATVSRDAEGHVTVRAVRLAEPLTIDGNLDEALYQTITPISDFVQAEPRPGTVATEKTEAWISFDDENVYVSVRASESQPERMIVNEMRRDGNSILQNENFGFAFDTFYDRRNSLNFNFNPIGGRQDGQNSNEGQYNGDWNPIWRVSVHRVPGGWTGEAAVPFKSLRYRPGRSQIWGIQMRRINRWKNELSFLTRVPDGLGNNGISRTSAGGTLVGIEAPSGSRALELKPYVTSNVTTDLTSAPTVRNAVGKDFGFDAKYGVTQNLTADFTYNTDFAQVEADEQQVNLTRFSLFFPEKRDFFLENQGTFNFGGAGSNNNTNASTNGIGTNSGGDVPILFYSRRIGLDQGRQVPIRVGGRLTGRTGPFSVGVIDVQSDDIEAVALPSANFAVARLKRDVLSRSAVGAIVTRRSNTVGGPGGEADTFGLDGTFSFFENLGFNAYWARTQTPGMRGEDTSYRAQMNYNADRYGAQLERLMVGDNFLPAVGFVRRDNMRKNYAFFRFNPRPAPTHLRAVRRFGYEGSLTYIENSAGHKESRAAYGEFNVDFMSSERVEISYADGYEFVPAAFVISRRVTIPAGGYGVSTFRAQLTVGQQRRASGNWFVEGGPFYGGNRTGFGYSGARVKLNPHLALEPGLSVNRVRLPYGDFTTTLLSTRGTYTVTPQLFISSLVQYNSSNATLSANLRLRWEYQPGSELFVVYNEGRDTLLSGTPELQNRSLVVKVNRLFRF